MAIHNVSTTSQLSTAMTNAVPGDEIVMAAGNYTSLSRSSLTKASPFVTIRPANVSNPPVIQGGSPVCSLSNVNGFIFDGITFRNTQFETLGDGKQYPKQGVFVLDVNNCSNLKFRNCWFRDGFHNARLRLTTNCEIGWCLFTGANVDQLQILRPHTNLRIHHNEIRAPNVYGPRAGDQPYHPDCCQGQNLNTDTGHRGTIIEDNWMQTWPGYQQMIFFHNERAPKNLSELNSYGHQNCIIRRNFLQGYHTHGICIGGHRDVLCEKNLIRQLYAGPNDNPTGVRIPTISFLNFNTGIVRDNVMPPGGNQLSGTKPATYTNNVFSHTALPPGWADTDVANGAYGPYGENVPPVPAGPATPGADDWSIGEVIPDPIWTNPQLYTAIIHVSPASVMIGAVGFRWSSPRAPAGDGQFTDHLSDLPDGTRRFQMRSIDLANSYHAVAAGVAHTGIKVQWRAVAGGPLSEFSSDTKSYTFTAPQPQEPPRLAGGEWSIGEVIAVEGGYTAVVHIPTSSAAFESAEFFWTADGVEEPETFVEIEALPDGTRRLRMDSAGTDHVKAADAPMTGVRVYHAAEEEGLVSQPSFDAKSWVFETPGTGTEVDVQWSVGFEGDEGSPDRVLMDIVDPDGQDFRVYGRNNRSMLVKGQVGVVEIPLARLGYSGAARGETINLYLRAGAARRQPVAVEIPELE